MKNTEWNGIFYNVDEHSKVIEENPNPIRNVGLYFNRDLAYRSVFLFRGKG
jgi:hypothetical protein